MTLDRFPEAEELDGLMAHSRVVASSLELIGAVAMAFAVAFNCKPCGTFIRRESVLRHDISDEYEVL